MEGVQKLPMISFDLKTSPENTDFGSKIKLIIRNSFGEDPETFSNEIRELESLRANSCIRISESIDGVATLKKYYCQLNFLKSRFKIGSDGPFQFTWRDIYGGSEYTYSEFSFELAAVLYNIGALHTRLGCQEERSDSDGMKMAVAHFQCAAWAFHSLPDLHSQALDTDFNSELLTFEAQIALAQAQECILEKSILDGRKPSIIAKVCGQVVVYYTQALRTMDTSNSRPDLAGLGSSDRILDIVGSKQNKMWKAFVEFKIPYYQCVAWLHMGMNSEETQRMGERVTYYQAAHDCLTQSAKLAKKLEGPFKNVAESLMFTDDVTKGKLEISKKENEFIYHEKVPDLSNMQEIKGASLVKGIAFDMNDPDVSGPDLFKRLVSLEAHESSSLYSEEKAKLLRNICGDIETADSELAVYMSSVQIEDIPGPSDHISLPQELIECAAGLSVRPEAVNQLQEAMAKLASVSADVEASLREIQGLLKEEEGKEEEHQQNIGKRPKSLMADLERETQKYHEAHSMASESNLTLHKAMQLHIKNLKLLSRPLTEIQGEIPSLDDLDTEAETTIVEVRRILDKVEEMRTQRAKLEEDLRRDLLEDDITGSLAVKGAGADIQQVFEEQLKKHDKTMATIRQNLLAQFNILSAFTESNARFADTRKKVTNVVRRREDMIGSLVASYHAYEDLLTKTTKGLEFYDKLEANVEKLLRRVGGVVKVQEEERQALMKTTEKKAAEARALSLSLLSGGMPGGVAAVPGMVPSMPPGYMSEFTPGAPPLDTPDQMHGGYQPPSVSQGGYQPPPAASPVTTKPSTGRPTLGDYLKARKESGLEMPGKASAANKKDEAAPGVRPQPLGSESEPPYSVHSMPGYSHQGYNYPGYPYQAGKPGAVLPQAAGMPGYPPVIPGGKPGSLPPYPPGDAPYPGVKPESLHPQGAGMMPYPQGPAPVKPVLPPYSSVPPPISQQAQSAPTTGQTYRPSVSQPTSAQAFQQPSSSAGQSYQPSGQIYQPQMSSRNVQPPPSQQTRPQLPTQPSQAFQQPPGQTFQPSSQPPVVNQNYQQPQGQLPGGYQKNQPSISQPHYPSVSQPSTGQTSQSGASQVPYGQIYPSQMGQTVQKPTSQSVSGQNYPQPQPTSQYSGNQSYQPPTGQVNQPPSSQSYQTPAAQMNQTPSSQPYPPPSSQPYPPPTSQPYQPPSSQTYQPPSSQPYQPPPSQTYQPPASQMNPPPSSQTYQPPPSMPSYAPTSKSPTYQQVYSRHILPPYTPAQELSQAGPGVPSLVRPPVPSFANLPGNQPHGYPNTGSTPVRPTYQNPNAAAQNQVWGQTSNPGQPLPPYQGQYPNASQPQLGSQRFPSPAPSPQQLQISQSATPQPSQAPSPNPQQFQPHLPTSQPQQHFPAQSQASYHQHQRPPTSQEPGGTLPQQTTVAKPPVPQKSPENFASSNLDLLAGLDISGPSLPTIPIQASTTTLSDIPPSKPVVPMPGTLPKPVPIPSAVPKPVVETLEPAMTDEERLQRLRVEAVKLDNLVSSLTSRTLSGPTPLESKWKEMQELLEALPGKRSVSVARCYPHKNRVPDVLPYDQTRLELKQKDDYINASHVRSLSARCPSLIVTQAPNQNTLPDFWTGIWQEQVETIMCLVPDSDLGSSTYIPRDPKSPISCSDFTISLQSCKTSPSHIERVINISHAGTKQTRALVHLQMLGWPGPDLPASPAPVIDTALALLSLHKQQRVISHPVLLHCTDGGTKSGTFAAVLSLLSEMESGSGPAVPSAPGFPDVTRLFSNILAQRKGIVRDKIYMNLVYEILLYYIQDSLMKQGILTRQTSHKSHNRHPSQDFILGPKATSCQSQKSTTEPEVSDANPTGDHEKSVDVNEGSNTATSEEVSNGSKGDIEDTATYVEDREPSGEVTKRSAENGKASGAAAKPLVEMASGFPDDLSKLVDFSLSDSPAKKKITKEDFMKPSSGISGGNDASDPLSLLDPLWSLK